MDSVKLNNTLQEAWKTKPDSGSQWSHCALAPLYIAYQGLAGIQPLSPGFKRVEIRPQLADIESLELVEYTAQGPLRFKANGRLGARELTLELPLQCQGELILPRAEKVTLERAPGVAPEGNARYRLPSGKVTVLQLRST